MLRFFLVGLLSGCLMACATNPKTISPKSASYLQEGKRQFEAGYYKRSMHDLLPLAVNGDAQAQYAVGYMYYYGYGVAQDTQVGYFWIQRSAEQQNPKAIHALQMMKVP